MPQCLKCGAKLTVNEEGVAPVLCDSCAGVATKRARRSLGAIGSMRQFPVTTALMSISIAVYVGMIFTGGVDSIKGFSGQELIHWGGNAGRLTLSGDYWRLVTACFVHGDPLHILLNMWCLWSLGRLSERLFGHWQTAAIYLFTGVGGALLSIAYNPMRLSVGASGAIFGIGGAALVGVKFGNLAISTGERRNIFSSLTFFVGINLMLGFSGFSLGGGSVDNLAHLGGLVSGLIIGLPLATSLGTSRLKTVLFQFVTLAITALLLVGGVAELVKTKGEQVSPLQRAFEREDYPAAIRILEPMAATNPNDMEILLNLAEAYTENHQPAKAIATLEKALQVDPHSPGVYVLMGAAYEETGDREKAIAAYEQALKLDPNMPEIEQVLQALRGNSPSKK